VQESDWGKSRRTRFGGMFVCTGRLDAKPSGGNRCKSKRTASFATSPIQREFRCLIGEPTPSSPWSASDLPHKIG
jgi:hypothetical protein